jgi:hypothetical protein
MTGKARWSLEIYQRANDTILVIYKDGSSRGSLTFWESEKEDIEIWKKMIEKMNLDH